ncbi:MAG: ABC transporter permease [Bacteroidetes bacterium]|nr:ABC transporter permease [Bacteroidota bacterium]
MNETPVDMNTSSPGNAPWTHVITPKNNWWELNLKEVWQYRDLIVIFVKRDFKEAYKQTILGPAWFFLQPLLTTLVSMFLFGSIAKLSDDGVPQFLFFFCGVSLWSFLASIIKTTSNTFTGNAALFSKIYYPRLVTPIAATISSALKLLIPFGLFLIIWAYYLLFVDISFKPTNHLLLVPFYILLFSMIGNSLGIIISALTTKYRDLQVFVSFGITLLMYMSAVQYSLAKTPSPFNQYLQYNPIVPIMESFRYAFFGSEASMHNLSNLGWTTLITIIITVVALILFKRTEKNFIDTV